MKNFSRVYGFVLSIGGLLGLIAMAWQSTERINMLKNPENPLNCNLSPVIDCGTVLSNQLAALFGFPNAFIGMAVFAMLTISGVAILVNVKFTKNFKKVVLGLATLLFLFCMWFFIVSLYSIGKICIFCAVGWVVSVPIFVFAATDLLSDIKRYSLQYKWLLRNMYVLITIWYVILLCLFLSRFRDFYFN